MSSFEVVLSSNAMDARELCAFLGKEGLVLPVEFRVELRRGEGDLRSLDQAVLVALVAGTSAAVSALFTGLLRLVESHFNRTAKIVVRGSDGTAVEVPIGTTHEELEHLVEIARGLNRPEVRLVLPPESVGRHTPQ
jgi:hypothetical protein